MTKHVVLIHRYFSPDTPPYASILEAIARELGSSGMRVTVLTCQPSYNRSVVRRAPRRETLAPNVEVRRFPVLDDRSSTLAKILNLLWFSLALVHAFTRLGKIHAVMAGTTPPIVVAALASRLARLKRAAFIYHKQDIYPEVTVALGARLGGVAHIIRAIDAQTDRRATRVVVLSEDMAKTVVARGVRYDRVEVINNFDPWLIGPSKARKSAIGACEGSLKVVFAGNLGRFQGLQTLFDAIDLLDDEPAQFHFFGHGALSGAVDELARRHGETRVVAHGYCDPSEVADFLSAEADLAVVSLAPGVIRAAYPSKTMSYLRSGTPILAMVEGGSELARMVVKRGIGVQCDPGDVDGLRDRISSLCHSRDRLLSARLAVAPIYEREFGRSTRLSQWTALFRQTSYSAEGDEDGLAIDR